jgi:hypothetical protein
MMIDPKTIPASYDILRALLGIFERDFKRTRNEQFVDKMIKELREGWVIKVEYLRFGETEEHRWTEFKLRVMSCDRQNLETVIGLLANMDPR